MNKLKITQSLTVAIIATQFLFALKNHKTELDIAVRHFNSNRFAIAEKILSKRTMEEWGEYQSSVSLLQIKCAYAQGHLAKTKVLLNNFHISFSESRYVSDVITVEGDIYIDEGFYSKALEYYLNARKYSDKKTKIDKRILKTIFLGLPMHDIEAIQLLEIDSEHLDILHLASAITHSANGNKSKASISVNSIDPLSLPEIFYNTYNDILKSVKQEKRSINKIGVVLPLTGESEERGNRFFNGLQEGFFSQSELDYSLVIYDNESSLSGTLNSLIDLSRYSNVSAIIGPLSSQFTLAAISSRFTDNKTIFLPYFEHDNIKEISSNSIRLNSSLKQKGRLSAKFMTEHLDLDSIAIIAPSSPEGRLCVDAFLEELDLKEIHPIFIEWYVPGTKTMKRQFSSLRKTAWDLIPEENEFEPFLGMDFDSLNALFSIDTDDFFEEDEDEENHLKTKRDSSKVLLSTIDGLYLPLAHEDLSIVGTQLPMYNIQTQIIGHDGWLDLETLNKENIGPHFNNLILLTSSMFKPLQSSSMEEFYKGNTEFVDGYDTALFLLNYYSEENRNSGSTLETHSHLYFFPGDGSMNHAVSILRYENDQFKSLGHFLSDSLTTYTPENP